ncbi:MAG: hypothetical protein U1C46_10745 [Bacteroidales bacterium]|nr:hypothetical protein [Bacteroidales bacterium]MDZ4205278.1 hypothetical protein [Bacteroidales bacterium]
MMRTKFPTRLVPRQTIGNIGLYFVCYQLSIFGWNVLPTSRNTKGVDIFIYSQNGMDYKAIQVKTLSKRTAVPLGSDLTNLISEYLILVVRSYPNEPVCYIMTKTEVIKQAIKREKGGKTSFWLPIPCYDNDKYKEKWERIGHGVSLCKKSK